MVFEPLVLEDKESFDSYTRGRHYYQSEASFANLYIWQHDWDIRIAMQDEGLFISFNNDDYRPFLLPPFTYREDCSIAPYMEMAEEYMDTTFGEFYMKGASANMVERIKRDCGKKYEFRYDESNSEYVYNTQDLAELPGKKYHGKRNHISGFLRNHYPALAVYAPKYRDACLLLQEEWAKARQVDHVTAEGEYVSIMRALDNYEYLGLQGLVVLLQGEVCAFTLGERLNEEMALIHIEKAKPGVNGLFAYINQQFVIHDWLSTKYINREEDMGVPGIRQAKRSYHPAFMIDKFDVIRKRQSTQ